jgi:hypothetical protein
VHRFRLRTLLLLYFRPMQTSPRFAYSFPKIGKGTFSPHRSVPRLIFGRAAPTSHQASGLGIAPVQHPNPADLLEIPPTPGLEVRSFCHGERRCEAREKVAVALAFPALASPRRF